jgi:hypothetical protein
VYSYQTNEDKLRGFSPQGAISTSYRRLSANLFADRRHCVVSTTDPYGRILGFLGGAHIRTTAKGLNWTSDRYINNNDFLCKILFLNSIFEVNVLFSFPNKII